MYSQKLPLLSCTTNLTKPLTTTRLQDLEGPAKTDEVKDEAVVAAEAADKVKDEAEDATVQVDVNLETSQRYINARQENG